MENATKIEKHGIGHIKDSERHGNPHNLFNIWSSTNLTLGSFITGSLAIEIGLGLWSSLLAICIGVILGAILIPIMSKIGWKLGVPQMVMTRPTFGRFGSIIPVVIGWISFLGWFTVLNVLGAQSLKLAFGLPISTGIILLSIITIIIGIFGHDLIHLAERWIALVCGITFIVVAIMAIPHIKWSYTGNGSLHGADWWGMFVLVVGVCFSYAGPGYTAYASDYTRYLPKSLKFKSIFIPTFLGMSISSILVFFLGAAILTINVKGDALGLIAQITGPFATVALLVLALGSIAANCLNVYSGSLTALVSGLPIKRWISAVAIGIIGMFIAIWAQADFVTKFQNFLLIILYTTPALDAILLTDFFLIRKGKYKLDELYGSLIPSFNVQGLIAYFAGIAISIPFMSATLYTGPIAKLLHGADIGYVIGMAVSALVYWGLRRKSINSNYESQNELPVANNLL